MKKYKIEIQLKDRTHDISYSRTKYVEAKDIREVQSKARKWLVKQSKKENKVFSIAYIFTKHTKGKYKGSYIFSKKMIKKGTKEHIYSSVYGGELR